MSLDDLFKEVKEKLASQQDHTSTEVDGDGTKKIEAYLYGAKPAKSKETAALAMFDVADTRIRRKTDEIKSACANLKWCAPYESLDYQKDIMEYIIAINDIHSSSEISIENCIKDHILLAVDESLLEEQEKIDKKEAFLHKAILLYTGFCKNRKRLVEQCKDVPEELKKPIYRALENAYELAFMAIAKSITLRNPDAIKKIGNDELKRLWEKGGSLREKSMRVIDDFSNAAAEYFNKEPMDAQAQYYKIMHSQNMKELLKKLEQQAGLEGFASHITNYV
jgi:hypothetical protein